MRRSTILILALAAIAAAIAAVVVVIAHRPASQIASGEALLPQLAVRLGDAASLSVKKSDSGFEIVRKDDKWVLPAKGDYPARPDLVRGILIGLAEIRTIEAKTRDAKLYDRLEVEDVGKDAKSTELTVKDKDGAVLADVLLGKRRGSIGDIDSNNALVYARKAGDPQSWLVVTSLEPRTNEVDWATRDVVDIAEDQIASVTLTGSDKQSITIERAKPEDKDFVLRDKPADMAIKSQFDVNAIADVLSSLTFEDVMPAASLAVPQSGTAKADFLTKDGLHVVVTLVPKDTEKWALVTASGEGDAAAKASDVAARVAGWAYRLPDYKSSKIETKRADLLEKPEKPQG
jgi:hypothetical protein